MVSPLAGDSPTESAAGIAPKLHKAAQDFEALLLTELLRIARSEEEGWLGGSDRSSGALRELGEEQVARALAASGGLGIGALIQSQLLIPDDKDVKEEGRHDHHERIRTAQPRLSAGVEPADAGTDGPARR